jgi:protein SCO1/2
VFKNNIQKSPFLNLILTLVVWFCTVPAGAIERPENVIGSEVGVFTELGVSVDQALLFTDDKGVSHSLSDYFISEKPLVIVPVYYKCPRLCGLLLDGVYSLINKLPLKLGDDFNVLVVGFDPTESASDAAEVRGKLNIRLKEEARKRPAALNYVVGDEGAVTTLMNQLGFRYKKDGEDFAHSAALMILTPTGEISQYFTGIEFSPWDVRLALVEASQGKIGTAIDHLLLYCFRFDPLQGKYTWAVVALLRVGGVLTLIGLGLVYFFFVKKGLRGKGKSE